MSFQVDTAYVNAYKAAIEIGFQQRGSRLRDAVRNETQNAEFAFYDRVTSTAAVKVTTRHGDTPLISTPHDRRRVQLVDYDWADLIDSIDKVRMLADPTSAYVTNAVYALGRAVDDEIILAASGTAYSGKTGATSVALPSASQVAVNYVETGSAVNSNLTIAKLRQIRYLLDSTEANENGNLIAAVTASQIRSLLRTTEVTNADYNSVKALVQGEIDTFMGFRFIRTERLAKSGNIRKALFWTEGALLLATGMEINVDVGPRRDKRNAVQVYASGSFGATRMWEEKLIECACDESVA